MPYAVAHRRCSMKTLQARHGASLEVVDVTSRGEEPWVRLSPFYAHGEIPVPYSPGVTAESVEGVWQALKVFASEDVDRSKLTIRRMKGLKRTVRRLGAVLGHREGLEGERVLGYVEARRRIYLPTYRWVLERGAAEALERLRALEAEGGVVVLLDYTTNGDVEDVASPLSHAALVVRYLEGRWPSEKV